MVKMQIDRTTTSSIQLEIYQCLHDYVGETIDESA